MSTPGLLSTALGAVRNYVADSWGNSTTNVGIEGKDKSAGFSFYRGRGSFLREQELADIYESDWAVAAIIDELPEAVYRRGYEFRSGATEVQKTAIDDAVAKLGVNPKFLQGQKYERAYGGAAILLGTGDTSPGAYAQPVREGAPLKFLTLFEASELAPTEYFADPFAPNYGEVRRYRLSPSLGAMRQSSIVHASHLVVFPGTSVSLTKRYNNDSWGISVVTRVYDVVRRYAGSLATAAATLADANQKVYGIKGLVRLLTDPNREAILSARIEAINKIRSVVNAITMDADEESVTNLSTPLAGFADILEKFEVEFCSAARMPVTVLLKRSPGGLNATGDSDLTIWNDNIRVEQRDNAMPRLERVYRRLLQDPNGPTGGKEPTDWSIHWHPLEAPSETEAADVRQKQAGTDQTYVDMGVKPSTILRARFGGPEYSTQLQLSAKDLKEIEANEVIEPPVDDDEDEDTAPPKGEGDPDAEGKGEPQRVDGA